MGPQALQYQPSEIGTLGYQPPETGTFVLLGTPLPSAFYLKCDCLKEVLVISMPGYEENTEIISSGDDFIFSADGIYSLDLTKVGNILSIKVN